MRGQHRVATTLAHDNVQLLCANNHEHLCGAPQVPALLRTGCPWCHTPLRATLWRDGADTYRVPAPEQTWPSDDDPDER